MRSNRLLQKVLFAVALALAVTAAAREEGSRLTASDVDVSVKKGAQSLLRLLPLYHESPGRCSLRVMAILNAGTSAKEPAVSDAIDYIVHNAEFIKEDYFGPYEAGLVNMLLGMLKDDKYKRQAEAMTRKLERLQNRDGGWGDYSRTQFALLGLKAASDLGIEVSPKIFASAKVYVESGQSRDGSWGYNPKMPTGYGSMTAAGVSSLFIINEQSQKNTTVCGSAIRDPRIELGLDWLGRNFTVKANPPNDRGYHFYYLYALERIGVLLGQKYIGGHDWYREGAEFLVAVQRADGGWGGFEQMTTEFALLFLGKGRAPVVMQKLDYGGDWNPDPYDAKELVEQASRDLGTQMTTQVVETIGDRDIDPAAVSTKVVELAAAPILYIQGRSSFEFSNKTREAIKGFVEQGGFIIASACCGGFRGFDRSFRREMLAMFPDASFEKLPESHEIYNVHYKITQAKAFSIEGLNTGCRTTVFYAPHDICCAWGGCKGCLDKEGIAGEEARNLGVNLIAYAIGFQALKNKLDDVKVVKNKADAKVERGALVFGQLYHDGEWNPDPASLPNLAKTLKEQTGMTAEIGKKQVVIGSDELGDYPILYITGHRAFQYSPSQIDALRAYLDKGGFLLADACCGRPEFDAAFRRLCGELYPSHALKQITPDHGVLREPYKIEKVEYKPSVKKLFPELGDKPFLEGISGADGRLQIMYSRFNLGCELQGHSCAGCLGVAGKDAYKIAVNAVMYALSH